MILYISETRGNLQHLYIVHMYAKYNFNYNFNELLTENESFVRFLLDARVNETMSQKVALCMRCKNK